MKFLAALWLFLFLPFFLLTTHAQQRPIKLESLSLDEGISYQTVYAIHQDSRGFLWIGTMSGLVRYDGYRNTVFRHDPAAPGTLSHDDIVSIFEDSRQKIWVGTYGGGLNRYDPETQLFERFIHDSTDSLSLSGNFVSTIAEDDQGKIWVGTQGTGINIFDPLMPNLGFRHLRRDPAKFSQSPPTVVHKILKSRDGSMWIGTHGRGLGEFQPGRQSFMYHPLISDKLDTIRSYKVFDIDEIGDELWLATNEGLRIWNRTKKSWSDKASYLPGKVTDSEIGRICMDQFGQVWIGTFGQGLLRVDTASWTVGQTKRNLADPFSLKSDVVTALFQDQSGLIWVGTAYGGLQKTHRTFINLIPLSQLRPGAAIFRMKILMLFSQTLTESGLAIMEVSISSDKTDPSRNSATYFLGLAFPGCLPFRPYGRILTAPCGRGVLLKVCFISNKDHGRIIARHLWIQALCHPT